LKTAGVFCQQDNQVIRLVRITATKQRLYNGKFRRMLLNKDEILELQQNCFLLVKLIVYKELKNIISNFA
jgi:hypothetical protein